MKKKNSLNKIFVSDIIAIINQPYVDDIFMA